MTDLTFLHDGRLMQVHDPDQCAGESCCIHKPSGHHMVTWPLNWRADRRIMERICPHGVGHPDPDDVQVRASEWQGIHGCDGCCLTPGGVGE